MPELPEVETTSRGISPHISQQRIRKITVRNPRLRWPVPVEALQQLHGQLLTKVERRAKYLLLHCETGYILLHLGMSGNLRIVDNQHPASKHDHVDIAFANGKTLRLNDPRRFGCCLYQSYADGEHPLLAKLGPEPLSDMFTGDYLYQLSRGKKQAVKSWIMSNPTVVGVGNIYAAESLFKAGINPKRAAGNVGRQRYVNLVLAIQETLEQAIIQGGTTLRDFVNSEGKPGYFQQTLQVYGREGHNCYQCGTIIRSIKLAQRSTYYCSQCQK